MKKIAFISVLLFFFVNEHSNAQGVPTAALSLNCNNIDALVMDDGNSWYCHFPTTSGPNITGPGAIWISGYDDSNHLHIAAGLNNEIYTDYWPGSFDTTKDTTTPANALNWDYLFKVGQPDIQYFHTNPIDSTEYKSEYQSIYNWPGKGNTNALGNSGVPLNLSGVMAPFVDLNGDGTYEPLLGEYPDIKGDQAIFLAFNDNGPTHNQTNGTPMGVEIHEMVYGYQRETLISNVVYYEYTIVNKSPNTYHNVRIALWDYPMLGNDTVNNYIGFDSTHRMAITYKASDYDSSTGGYGSNIPVSAITMVALPGDTGTSYVPVGSFTYYNNDASAIGNPTVDTEYDNYMRSKLRNGQHFTNDFQGAGIPAYGTGTGPNCNYVYPGDPSNNTQWSECVCGNRTVNRRYVLSSNDFTLNPGESKKAVFALITTNPEANNGCPSLNFNDIRTVADTAWNIYNNPLPPLPPSGVSKISINSALNIYPNPAHDKLYIESTGFYTGGETIIVYNTLGQIVNIPLNKSGQKYTANISGLADGMYFVLYRNDYGQVSAKFLKE